MAKLYTYSPDRVIVTWGSIVFTGFMDGTFVECERDEDGSTKHVGAQGDVTRVKNLNRTGTFTITLVQTSPTNDDLSAQNAVDEGAFPGVVQPMMVKDANGKTAVLGAQAWIKKVAKVERGKEVVGQQWVFDCAEMKVFAGGAVA